MQRAPLSVWFSVEGLVVCWDLIRIQHQERFRGSGGQDNCWLFGVGSVEQQGISQYLYQV